MAPLSAGRSIFRISLAGVALALPFLAAFLICAEAWLRITTNLPYVSRTRCFSAGQREAPAFLPDCEETLTTPGGQIHFKTNGDGFRDRTRSFFGTGAIAVLGDSYVEGFWLAEENGLTRVLERKLGWKQPLLNLGIRASGPTQQAIRLFRALGDYPIAGALWFLNPSDPIDEIFFRARNPDFTFQGGSWSNLKPLWDPPPLYWTLTRLSLALRDKSYVLFYITERWIKQRQQAGFASGPFSTEVHCQTLEQAANRLRVKGLPLLFVAMPHGLTSGTRNYMGLEIQEGNFDALLGCARRTGFPVLDLRKPLSGHPEWYWKNDWHFNVEGVDAVAAIAAPLIKGAWPAGSRVVR